MVNESNKNRQVVATSSTVGRLKVDAMAARLLDISSATVVTPLPVLITPDNARQLLEGEREGSGGGRYDFVVDCIDSVPAKAALLQAAVQLRMRVLSSCGAGNRVDPSQVALRDLFETEGDALARHIRAALRKNGVVAAGDVTCAHSTEVPVCQPRPVTSKGERPVNGTVSYMPPLFGLLLASAVIREGSLSEEQRRQEDRARRKKVCNALKKKKGKGGANSSNDDKGEQQEPPSKQHRNEDDEAAKAAEEI